MGQYYIIANLDKKQYLSPHRFGDGLKLMEFGNSGQGTLLGLTVLLADGNNRGGGDLRSENPIVGSWAGDRIVVAGDYADPGKFIDPTASHVVELADELGIDPENLTLHAVATGCWDEISAPVIRAIADGEGPQHPLAHIDLSEEGWRSRPSWEYAAQAVAEQNAERTDANAE